MTGGNAWTVSQSQTCTAHREFLQQSAVQLHERRQSFDSIKALLKLRVHHEKMVPRVLRGALNWTRSGQGIRATTVYNIHSRESRLQDRMNISCLEMLMTENTVHCVLCIVIVYVL